MNLPPVRGRSFGTVVPGDVLTGIQDGVLRTTYRGVTFLKSPFDVLLYLRLIDRLRPRAVVEIGARHGGSALWFADTLRNHGIDGTVVAVDVVDELRIHDPDVEFVLADATALASSPLSAVLERLPRPWLVVEDSAHTYETSLAVLEHFHGHLRPGDYIVVEDGVVSSLPGDEYREYADGPNRAVATFLGARGDAYEIDVDLCDHYGPNVTYNPNAWLRRTRR